MNGKELFLGLSYINRKFIDEAERDTVSNHGGRERAGASTVRSLRRPLLVAALAALLLLLVGCAVVYVLRSQDFIIGQRDSLQNVFDEYHREVTATVPVSQQVLTFSGLQGSPSYQAAKEWYAYLQAYDTDGIIRKQAFQTDPEAQFPDTYPAYGVYSQEMADKLEELAEKYQLKLLRSPVEFESMSGFAKALGIDHILLPDSNASVFLDSGECYSQGNFVLYMDLNLPEEVWPYSVHTKLQYFRKDCLSTDVEYLNENEGWKEWMYTTSSGAAVLILRAAQGRAYLVCDCGDAAMTVDFEAGFNPLTDMPDFQPAWMTDRQVEQIADAIDFTVRPTLPDASAAAAAAPPAGWEIETTSVTFDGSVGRVVFHLTAPAGTQLPDAENADYVYPQNDNLLIPDTGSFKPNFWQVFSQEDGDGKDNTINLVYIFAMETVDDPTFPRNAGWHAHLVDLMTTSWNGESPVNRVVAQGVWEPEVRFADCDHRKIDFLSSPLQITVDGVPITIASLQLRTMGTLMTVTEGMEDAGWMVLTVVMKDGAEIHLGIGDSTGRVTRNVAEAPIDLSQVALLRLPDGTELPSSGAE